MPAPSRRFPYPLRHALLLILFALPAHAVENGCGPLTPCEEQLVSLQQENALLGTKIRQLETVAGIPASRLHQRKIQRLHELAADVRTQRQSMGDFQGFVAWMSSNLAGYNRYIQAGSYAAVVGRMLPIPYAGQVAIFTKFAAQFTVELNASSKAIGNYLDSSRKFIAMTDRLNGSAAEDDRLVSEAARFADRQLLKDMNAAQTRLAAVSDLSSGALSFLGSLNHYASSTDEYMNRARGMFNKGVDPKEKSFITESTGNLKARADRFNARLRYFEELGKKETASVKALAVYDELEREARNGSLLK
jgi:hypothetical protein